MPGAIAEVEHLHRGRKSCRRVPVWTIEVASHWSLCFCTAPHCSFFSTNSQTKPFYQVEIYMAQSLPSGFCSNVTYRRDFPGFPI